MTQMPLRYSATWQNKRHGTVPGRWWDAWDADENENHNTRNIQKPTSYLRIDHIVLEMGQSFWPFGSCVSLSFLWTVVWHVVFGTSFLKATQGSQPNTSMSFCVPLRSSLCMQQHMSIFIFLVMYIRISQSSFQSRVSCFSMFLFCLPSGHTSVKTLFFPV